MIQFSATKAEYALIGKIADRAKKAGIVLQDRQSLVMDLDAAHSNGCPIDFERLLTADDFNFAHDVVGIQRHIDRDDDSPTGGQLLHCFLPRFHQREAVPA